MVTFEIIDYAVVLLFFILIAGVGFLVSMKVSKSPEDYHLSNRNIGLLLFVTTNVATWYGGILGVGEFSYKYGLASWFTQSFPYYIFAFLFALFFVGKIRTNKHISLPETIEATYGKRASQFAALLVFILVNPAPYLLMMSLLIEQITGLSKLVSTLLIMLPLTLYLMKGGYKTNVYTDAIMFVLMFFGFGMILFFTFTKHDGLMLFSSLPDELLTTTGGQSGWFITVWFLIALWTFADPGFHQRTKTAKTTEVARYGILISIPLWALFDILTNTTGLMARALLPNLENPTLSFPALAQIVLEPGWKGLFFVGMFATILSTLNSFLFLGGQTIGHDILNKIMTIESIRSTRIGIVITALFSIGITMISSSVIQLWYLFGSFAIPPLLILLVGSYFEPLRLTKKIALLFSIITFVTSIAWQFARMISTNEIIQVTEPMIAGLFSAMVLYLGYMGKLKIKKES